VAGIGVARALRDDGFEAIDIGEGRSAASIARAAVDEDVVAVCVPSADAQAVAAELAAADVAIAVIEVVDPASAAGAVKAAILH